MLYTLQTKFTFSGHDSFQCRQLWLKKGYDFVEAGKSFNDESAVLDLGVGKNMVSSIRFWLKAFGITNENDTPTLFGRRLFSDEGWDPYLEDEVSLWLLHYQLVKSRIASSYHLIFNEFRRERIEFTKRNYIDFIHRKSEANRHINFNERTVGDDFEVFRKLYLADESGANFEDSFAGLLSDLDLLEFYKKASLQETAVNNRERAEAYYIENNERPSLPVEVFLFAILEQYPTIISISLNNLSNDWDGPGSVFALSRSGIWNKAHQAAKDFDWVTVQDYAGVQELQFKERRQPLIILDDYYARN